jgi:hypothetical protein
MPQDKKSVASVQNEMAKGANKAYNRDQVVGLMKGIDRITYLERKNQDIPQPRPNKEFINGKGANDVMAFTGQLKRDARIENTGDRAARQTNASRVAAQNASGRTPSRKPTAVAKPVSAAAGAKMVGAMSGKSNGTFKGGGARSKMSAAMKIK